MSGPPPDVAAGRLAVRRALTALLADPSTSPGEGAPLVLVACSGGADSLALAACTAHAARGLGVRAGAVVVDHDLADGSAAVAGTAAQRCRDLGLG
ncbi:ATP-binding protein, partial [Sanguibacter suaedae]